MSAVETASAKKHPRIGLALGSGAARGCAHIGVIDALLEFGIEPQIICGTSIGALVGAAYVAGKLSEVRQWAEAATWREIAVLMDIRLSGGGLIEGGEIIAFLRRLGIDGAIENYAKPFAAIATDLASGREIWLQSGPIHEATRASIALPGILAPVRVEGKWLVDGGLVNPVPVSVCRALGADVIIAVNLNGDLVGRRFVEPEGADRTAEERLVSNELVSDMLKQLPALAREQAAQVAAKLLPSGPASPGYFEVLANSINIMQDHITRARLAGEPPHVMLTPRLQGLGLMEFNRGKEAIAEGRRCVEEAAPALRRYV